MFKKVAVLAFALMLTGCNNVQHALFPGDPPKSGTNASSVCRSTPSTGTRDIDPLITPPLGAGLLTDNTAVLTGETNGEDGVTETATLCKRDSGKNLVGCQTMTGTGVLSDGTMIEFTSGYVTAKLAKSNGWARLQVVVTFSCHA